MSKYLIIIGIFGLIGCSSNKSAVVENQKLFSLKLDKADVFCSDVPKEGCVGCYFGYRIKFTNNSKKPVKLFSSKINNECFESIDTPDIRLLAPLEKFREIGDFPSFKSGGMEMVIQNIINDTIINSGKIIYLVIGPKFKFGGTEYQMKERFVNFIDNRDSMSLEIRGLLEGQDIRFNLDLN